MSFIHVRLAISSLIVGLALWGCSKNTQTHSPDSANAGDPIQAALASPERLASDRQVDALRKPDQVLAFFDIKPGMVVLDMFSGGGYYTEILSHLVGPSGKVHAHNNTPYLQFVKTALEKRFTPGRLANVERFTAENNELELPAETFDAALLVLSYHDVYHVMEEAGWTKIDGPAMLAEIYQSLKPGAVLGVVDHAAKDGAPAEVGETLHRIDPARAKAEISAAGFVFEAESDALRNPDDDRTKMALDKSIRGKTDRFIFRFRKP